MSKSVCSCINNTCPNTCEHKQNEIKNTPCNYQNTCDCECMCPGLITETCDICQTWVCEDCVFKISNRPFCKFNCGKNKELMKVILTLPINDAIRVFEEYDEDQIKAYLQRFDNITVDDTENSSLIETLFFFRINMG